MHLMKYRSARMRVLYAIFLGFVTVVTCIVSTFSWSSVPLFYWLQRIIFGLQVFPMRFLVHLVPSYRGSFYPDSVVYSAYLIEALTLSGIYFVILSALSRPSSKKSHDKEIA